MSITGMENAFHEVQDLVVNQVTLKEETKREALIQGSLKQSS